MPRISPINQDHIDYHIVLDPRPDGPVIGFLGETPIVAAVLDYFGRRFVYDGVAPRRPNGRFDIDALKPGEGLVEPGLVYRIESEYTTKAA